MRPVIDSPGVSFQLVVPRQLDRAVTADIHSLIAQTGMHARVPIGSIRRLKMRPDADKEHHVVQLPSAGTSLTLRHISIKPRKRHLSSSVTWLYLVPMAIPDIAGVALGL